MALSVNLLGDTGLGGFRQRCRWRRFHLPEFRHSAQEQRTAGVDYADPGRHVRPCTSTKCVEVRRTHRQPSVQHPTVAVATATGSSGSSQDPRLHQSRRSVQHAGSCLSRRSIHRASGFCWSVQQRPEGRQRWIRHSIGLEVPHGRHPLWCHPANDQ